MWDLWWPQTPETEATAHTALELMCCHSTVLLLPDQHQPAAAELRLASDDFLADLGAWLNHMQGNCTLPLSDELLAAVTDMGTGLLLYAVRHRMEEAVDLLVSVARASGDGTGWLAHAAGCDAGGGGGCGLLHAAMGSGHVGMLEKVLRWGMLYGGRQWRWPWPLVDATGCMALHLVMTHSEDVSRALVETLVRMLGHGEVRAAHQCWLREAGAVGATPAQCFSALHGGRDLEGVWTQGGSADKAPAATATAAAGGSSGGAADGSSGSQPAAVTATSAARRGTLRAYLSDEWRDTLMELWRWSPSPQYQQWAREHVSCAAWVRPAANCQHG